MLMVSNLLCYSTKLINSCQAETNIDTEKKPIFWDYHQRISCPYQTCEKQHQKKMIKSVRVLENKEQSSICFSSLMVEKEKT